MNHSFERLDSSNIDTYHGFARAEEVLALDRIREKDFEDLYGKENVERDLAEIKKLEENPEFAHQSKLATISEAIIHEQLEASEWAGPNARTVKASRYDDIKHGIDEIVEFTDDPGKMAHLALGVDVTFSPAVERKMERIREHASRGKLATIKYFKIGAIRGELKGVPQVVIGADVKTLEGIIPIWTRKDNKALAEHPMQIILLEEMRMQLEVFALYAEQMGKPEIARKYKTDLGIVLDILDAKKELRKKTPLETLRNDQVFNGIYLYLERFKKSLAERRK